jgi:hypothetical protein
MLALPKPVSRIAMACLLPAAQARAMRLGMRPSAPALPTQPKRRA